MAVAKTQTALDKSKEEAARITGRELIITNSACGLAIGSKIKVNNTSAYTGYINVITNTGASYNLYPNQYKTRAITAEELNDEKQEREKEIKELNRKMAFLEDTGLATFDDTEFKVYNIPQELKENDSDIGKAKAIAKLLS